LFFWRRAQIAKLLIPNTAAHPFTAARKVSIPIAYINFTDLITATSAFGTKSLGQKQTFH
jgi:hypothetical protein